MAAVREKDVVKAIIRHIEQKYPRSWVFIVHGGAMQAMGVPDLLVCLDGRFIGIEVKFQRPSESAEHARGRATPIQRAMIQKILDAGGSAGVALSPEEADEIIQKALAENS